MLKIFCLSLCDWPATKKFVFKTKRLFCKGREEEREGILIGAWLTGTITEKSKEERINPEYKACLEIKKREKNIAISNDRHQNCNKLQKTAKRKEKGN